MSDEQHMGAKSPAAAPADPAGAGGTPASVGVTFHCVSCGRDLTLPGRFAGRRAKCPKCGAVGRVGSAPEREPDVGDVRLDDLVDDASPAPTEAPRAETPPESLALAGAPGTPARRARAFFAGNPAVNLVAGLVGGAHLVLVCLALSMLALMVNSDAGLLPHALPLLLPSAALGCLMLAFAGRLPVALGAPEPSAVLCVFLLLAALGQDMAGRESAADIAATVPVALALAALLSGLLGIALSRFGLARRVRFLPVEILGGMLAGFGLLLIRGWGEAMLASSPALAAIPLDALERLGPALAQNWPLWTPALVFGVICFAAHMLLRGILWPLLAAALAVAGWNALDMGLFSLPDALAPLQAALTGPAARLPNLLDIPAQLSLYDPAALSRVHWAALAGRAEYFAAVAAMAILPSIVRTPILEAKLDSDADGGGQMRVIGAASLLSGLAGAMPSSLSLSTSLGVLGLGARGPLTAFFAGALCLAALCAGGPLLAFVPAFVPLGLLLAIGLVMPVGWMLRDARNPLTRREDLRAAWGSCLFVALLGPVLGVFLSLGLGVLLSLARAVDGGGVRQVQSGDVYHSNVERPAAQRRVLRERGGCVMILRLHGYLFLGVLYGVARRMRQRLAADGGDGAGAALRYVVLDFGAVTGLGAAAAIGFRRLESLARSRGLLIYLTSAPLEMEDHLEGLGYRMGDESGACRVALNPDYALELCEDAILAESGLAVDGARGGLAELLPEVAGGDALERLLRETFPEPALVPALLRCLERREVPRRGVIVRQGEPSDSMYFLQSGKVHVELSLPGGKVMRLKKMGPGTVFGEMGLYTSAPRSASVVAVEPCVVRRLSLARFRLIQEKAPHLAAAVNRFLVTQLAERVAEANARARAMQD